MPPKKRKSLIDQQPNKTPTWQKRISSFFITPGTTHLGISSSPITARPDAAITTSHEAPTVAAAAQGSPAVHAKPVHCGTRKDVANRDQRTPAFQIFNPNEHEDVHSTKDVRWIVEAELEISSQFSKSGEDADNRDDAGGNLDSRKTDFLVREDLSKTSFKLLFKTSSLRGKSKEGTRSTEYPVGCGVTHTLGRDNLEVLPLNLRPKAPHGHLLVENFVTAEEEAYLLHCLDCDLYNPWKISRVNGVYMGKVFGVMSVRRSFTDQTPLPPMPKFLKPYVERMRSQVPVLRDFSPNDMNAIDYRKAEGHWLRPHMDDRQLSGTVLVNLSLGGTCIMTYAQERGGDEVYRVELPRRSLQDGAQVLTGDSRYKFTHGIHKDDFLSPRRVSMTFRKSIPLDQRTTG